MITIEETAYVDGTHQVTIPVPEWVASGHYRVVLVLADEPVVSLENDPVVKLIGAFSGSGEAVGRNAEDILYGHNSETANAK